MPLEIASNHLENGKPTLWGQSGPEVQWQQRVGISNPLKEAEPPLGKHGSSLLDTVVVFFCRETKRADVPLQKGKDCIKK